MCVCMHACMCVHAHTACVCVYVYVCVRDKPVTAAKLNASVVLVSFVTVYNCKAL